MNTQWILLQDNHRFLGCFDSAEDALSLLEAQGIKAVVGHVNWNTESEMLITAMKNDQVLMLSLLKVNVNEILWQRTKQA